MSIMENKMDELIECGIQERDECYSTIMELKEKLMIAIIAVKFYADVKNYRTDTQGRSQDDIDFEESIIDFDLGTKARMALSILKEQK